MTFRACFVFVFVSLLSFGSAANAERKLLTGREAMGDWTTDVPDLRRKITVEDLPQPNDTKLVSNFPSVIKRPADAQLNVPPGFKIEEYARGFQNPRFLLTAPNGDIFVTESAANRITVLRDTNGDGKPDLNVSFAEVGLNQPFGIAFYPPGPKPNYLYVANTDGVVRFPYANGDTHARAEAEKLNISLSAGGFVPSGGHWTRDIVFLPDGKRMLVSIGSRSNVSDNFAEANRARIFESDPEGPIRKFLPGESATRLALHFGREPTSFG